MSADNFIAVLKEGDKYIGYHCSASILCEVPGWRECYSCKGIQCFKVNSIEEAIIKCENFDYLEYGYRFIDYKNEELEEFDIDFCKVCAHNPDLPEEGSKKAKDLGCNCKKIGPGFSLGKDCPVHCNAVWQKKVGFESFEEDNNVS